MDSLRSFSKMNKYFHTEIQRAMAWLQVFALFYGILNGKKFRCAESAKLLFFLGKVSLIHKLILQQNGMNNYRDFILLTSTPPLSHSPSSKEKREKIQCKKC